MKLFFGKKDDAYMYLDREEWHHLSHVMRTRQGDKVMVSDGMGNVFECIIDAGFTKEQKVVILSRVNIENPVKAKLALAVAPAKQMERTEWMLEKAVEMGLNTFYPLICKHSERKEINIDRLQKIVQAAAKQSLQPQLMQIHPMMRFDDFIQLPVKGNRFICHQGAPSLKPVISAGADCTFIIGPEGDFNERELESAIAHNYLPVGLGHNRLRTETAALQVVMAFHWTNNG